MQSTLTRRPVSMKDVADHLGVSKATVSRALSGKSEIPAVTRNRINQACEQLGYRLNTNIQDLVLKSRSGTTRNIAFVLVERDFSDPVYSSLMDGIAQGIKDIQYNLMLVKLEGNETNVYDLPPLLRDGRLDGMLVSGNLSPEIMNALKKLDVEIVALGCYPPTILKGINNVQKNIEREAYESVEMAMKANCKRIALFEEVPNSFTNVQVYNYIKAATLEYGVEFKDENFYHGTVAYSGAKAVMKPVLEQKDLPFDCIICWDFRTAEELASLIMGRCGLNSEPDVKIIVSRPYPHFELSIPGLYLDGCSSNLALVGIEKLLEQLRNDSKIKDPIQIKI